MKTKIIGGYSIFLGVVVFGVWATTLLKDEIHRGFTEVTFHLLAELTMAVICVVGGNRLLKNGISGKNLNLIGLGMAVYSILNAAGYYGQNGNGLIMLLFLGLLTFTVACIVTLFVTHVS